MVPTKGGCKTLKDEPIGSSDTHSGTRTVIETVVYWKGPTDGSEEIVVGRLGSLVIGKVGTF